MNIADNKYKDRGKKKGYEIINNEEEKQIDDFK
jgi:hypothetical protein